MRIVRIVRIVRSSLRNGSDRGVKLSALVGGCTCRGCWKLSADFCLLDDDDGTSGDEQLCRLAVICRNKIAQYLFTARPPSGFRQDGGGVRAWANWFRGVSCGKVTAAGRRMAEIIWRR